MITRRRIDQRSQTHVKKKQCSFGKQYWGEPSLKVPNVIRDKFLYLFSLCKDVICIFYIETQQVESQIANEWGEGGGVSEQVL